MRWVLLLEKSRLSPQTRYCWESPLKHLQIAIGVSERGERQAADESLNADGFAFADLFTSTRSDTGAQMGEKA
jgi:hypothetical protein